MKVNVLLRHISLPIEEGQVADSLRSSPFQGQPSLDAALDDQFVSTSIEPLQYPSLLFSCLIYILFLSTPKELPTVRVLIPQIVTTLDTLPTPPTIEFFKP